MKRKWYYGIMNILMIFLFSAAAHAQSGGSDVYWHIDPHVRSCSMVLDSSLTQDQWHRFVKQVAAISSFKSLSAAKTLGKMKFKFAIEDAFTPVDQHDLAWINTFTHPDEDCPLGDRITYPTIRAGMGISDKIDIGAYWTTAAKANYGMVGGEFKYAFLQESRNLPAAAVRASTTILTGVPDFNLNFYSLELMASKKIAMLTPYIGVKDILAIGTETTNKVNLPTERLAIIQGYAGVVYSIWKLNLATEYNVSSVNTFAFAIGYNL